MVGPEDKKDEFLKTPSGADQRTTPYRTPEPSQPTAELTITDSSLHPPAERFELLAEIGRGGMGIVYRARDRETGEIVALKVLKPEIAARPEVIERFKSELRLARKITHKNVCRTFDLHRFGDTVAIAMEYVEGESLRHILSRYSPLSVRKGTEWASRICAALAEAHAQGIVHRDLKPENILVDSQGNVKVMDFGIARSIETDSTATGSLLGTPAYMSPEQAEGKPADARSDIYSLGLMLYEMFTGQSAFRADTPVAFALKQIHETPPPPREVERHLPAFLDRAIQRCLEKNPKKRFQSVAELEAALGEEPEVKPAAAKAEDVEVPVPIHLAVWQRSDWWLLISAALSATMFFLLFFRIHPASALQVRISGPEATKIIEDALKGYGGDFQIGKPYLDLFTLTYPALVSALGAHNAHDAVAQESMTGFWSGPVTRPKGERKFSRGDYRVDLKGRVQYLRIPQDISPGLAAPLPPDPTAIAQMKGVAEREVAVLLGQDVAGIGPSVSFSSEVVERRNLPLAPMHSPARGVAFEWKVPSKLAHVLQILRITVEASKAVEVERVMQLDRTPLPSGYWGKAFGPPVRWVLASPVILLLVSILFLARRLYRLPRSPQNLFLAALAGSCVAGAYYPDLPEVTGPGGGIPKIVWAVLVFCLITLTSYMTLNTVLYYAQKRFPLQVANLPLLLRKHLFARAAGLELLRGSLAGMVFTGFWMGLVSLAGLWGKAQVGMMLWVDVLRAVGLWGSLGPFTVLLVGEILLIGCLLVALPLSLFVQATERWPVLLAALSGLWLAIAVSLSGAMVFPEFAYHLAVATQAVFFGWVFIRFGLLATLSAVFTAETALLAFPFWTLFRHLEPWGYSLPIWLWFLMFFGAAAIYLRPQLASAYQRVAAVFE